MSKIRGKQLENDTVTATQAETTSGGISTVNAGDVVAEGSGAGLSRRDHQHGVATGVAGAIQIGDAAAEGSSSDLSRADHAHSLAVPAAPADVTKATAAAGTATSSARADHKHDISTATSVEITDSTNTEGTATSLARSDHQHSHGNRGGGALHAGATPSVAGFLSASDKTKLDTLIDPNFRDPKDSVRLLTTSNVATLSGNQTVDGVLTAPGERVGLFGQTTVTEDGIYVTASGAWTRSADFQSGSGQAGALIPVEEGSSNNDKIFLVTNDVGSDIVGTDDLIVLVIAAGSPRGAGAGLILSGNDLDVVSGNTAITVNPNDITFSGLQNDAQHGDRGGGSLHDLAVAAGAAGFMSGADKTKIDGIEAGAEANDVPQQESVTTQVVSGSDTALTDTLNNTPISNASVILHLNGIQQEQGATKDYTVSGTTITWLASTGTAVGMETSDVLIATYLS